MSHEIELYGCLTIPDDANFDEITDVFLGFVESHGWDYGGGRYVYCFALHDD